MEKRPNAFGRFLIHEEISMDNQIKWLFFDIGSTLVDEGAAYEHRLRDISEAANVPFEQVQEKALEFYRQNRKGDKETAKYFGVPLPDWHSEDESPYPDAAATLARLHSRFKIGIIANQLPGTRARLDRYRLLPHIDLIVASAEEGVSKPDPRIFQIALDRADCRPWDAVMIGDRIDNDIVPARELGMRTAWIKQGYGQYWTIRRDTEQPDAIIHSLTELSKLF